MDIVEKLKKAVCSEELTEKKIFTILKAADEIERLREENKMMKYYLPENIDFVRCSEGKDHFNFEIVYKAIGGKE